MSTISVNDLEALIEQFRRNEWREMHLRFGDVELFLSTDGLARLPDRTSTNRPTSPAAPAASPEQTTAALTEQPAASPATTSPSTVVAQIPAGWVQVRAPSLGTFYGAPKPGAPKFADIGARVTPDNELCLIEVMKLFTTMRAGVSGVVRDIYVKDGELVEFDQPLFLIELDA